MSIFRHARESGEGARVAHLSASVSPPASSALFHSVSGGRRRTGGDGAKEDHGGPPPDPQTSRSYSACWRTTLMRASPTGSRPGSHEPTIPGTPGGMRGDREPRRHRTPPTAGRRRAPGLQSAGAASRGQADPLDADELEGRLRRTVHIQTEFTSKQSSIASMIRSRSSSSERAWVWHPRSVGTEATNQPSASRSKPSRSTGGCGLKRSVRTRDLAAGTLVSSDTRRRIPPWETTACAKKA